MHWLSVCWEVLQKYISYVSDVWNHSRLEFLMKIEYERGYLLPWSAKWLHTFSNSISLSLEVKQYSWSCQQDVLFSGLEDLKRRDIYPVTFSIEYLCVKWKKSSHKLNSSRCFFNLIHITGWWTQRETNQCVGSILHNPFNSVFVAAIRNDFVSQMGFQGKHG